MKKNHFFFEPTARPKNDFLEKTRYFFSKSVDFRTFFVVRHTKIAKKSTFHAKNAL